MFGVKSYRLEEIAHEAPCADRSYGGGLRKVLCVGLRRGIRNRGAASYEEAKEPIERVNRRKA